MTAAFIDLDFHLTQTKSSQFFIDILCTVYPDLHIVGANNAWYSIPRIKPDTIIIWQKIFTSKEIDSWQAANVVYIPMLDAVPLTETFWNEYRPYKIFCFSRTLFTFLKQRGFFVFYNQYYTKPVETTRTEVTIPSVFYWERSPKINWPLVKQLLEGQRIASLHYHYSTNIACKNEKRPTESDVKQYAIIFSDWFKDNTAFGNLLSQNDVFIAPRDSEGIGLSFIEALAHGNCVAAYNAPTMNEYITSGTDGFLFTNEKGFPLNLEPSVLKAVKIAAYKRAIEGYARWNETIPAMMNFISTPVREYYPRIHVPTLIFKRLRAEIRYIYKKLKNSIKQDETNYRL